MRAADLAYGLIVALAVLLCGARIVEVHNGSLEPDGSRRPFLLGAMPGGTPHE